MSERASGAGASRRAGLGNWRGRGKEGGPNLSEAGVWLGNEGASEVGRRFYLRVESDLRGREGGSERRTHPIEGAVTKQSAEV